jgi:ATP-dependent protease Clp ATPase subunit
LMMIMEELLLDPMYVLPSQRRGSKDLIITRDMVERKRVVPETDNLLSIDDAAA